jgi:hypothetical protein
MNFSFCASHHCRYSVAESVRLRIQGLGAVESGLDGLQSLNAGDLQGMFSPTSERVTSSRSARPLFSKVMKAADNPWMFSRKMHSTAFRDQKQVSSSACRKSDLYSNSIQVALRRAAGRS